MAEMDIYMRRRLVALGGLVAFFIIFVLLVKSCGGDDEPATVTSEEPAGATGETGAALPVDEFIVQADAICGPANLAVSELDPADTNATQQEYEITRRELKDLRSLELAEPDRNIDRFLADLALVVDALGDKAAAVESGDVAAQDAAQLEIDTAEVEAREAGEQAGFSDCGDFLDAGETPTGGGGGGGTEATTETDTGAVAPTDTTVVPPADTSTPVPPADDGTTAPPTDDTGGGGITP
jgi:hypothetical protein